MIENWQLIYFCHMRIFVLLLSLYFMLGRGFTQDATLMPAVFSKFYLDNDEVYIGREIVQNDTNLILAEWHLGKIEVDKKQINSQEDFRLQDSIQVELVDGSRYYGRLLEADSFRIRIQHKTGSLLFFTSQMQTCSRIEETEKPDNPNSTRYFFAPSAIPLEKGAGYYQNAYLLMNSVNFGLSPHLSLGGGVIIPLAFYITPKISYQAFKNVYLGAGFIAASTFIPESIMSGGIPFGLFTYGNEVNNATLGVGYGLIWVEGEYDHTQYPITTLNGMLRLSNRIVLVTENWLIPIRQKHYVDEFEEVYTYSSDEFYMALSAGLRIRVGKKSTVDFAPVLLQTEETLVLPYLDFVYKF